MSTRDGELYKDKVEVSLDGRQIFYLFFGGAVIVGMVFVLGVLVGRRVEARGHIDRAHTAAASDPLAALDRLESTDGMAFRGSLSGQANEAPVDKAIAELAEKRGTAPVVADPKKTEKKVDVKSDEKKDEKSADKKSEEKVADKKDEKKDEKKADKKSEEKKDEKKSEEKKKSEAKSEEPSDSKVQAKNDDKKSDDKKDDKPVEKKERYTLQLSSFQDKSEAETFLDTMKAKGFNASLTTAEVDGKGTFYRVRMGTYKSLDAATSAKSEFEKAASHNASIMKI